MKKIITLTLMLALLGLSHLYAQTGIYKGTAKAKCTALSLDETLDDVDVILKQVGSKYNLVVDQIDLGGGIYTPIIEIPNVTATPSGSNWILTAPDMNIVIPEVMSMQNVQALVKLKEGSVVGEKLTLKLDVTAMSFITVSIDYTGTKTNDPFEGSGEENDPYRIYKLIHMLELNFSIVFCPQCYYCKYIKQYKDIFFGGYQSTEPWSPIGPNLEIPFQGYYDGNNKKIIGLKIKPDTVKYPDMIQDYFGLFGCVFGGSVKNLAMEDFEIDYVDSTFEGSAYLGAIAGYVGNGGSIEKCSATGKLKSKTSWRRAHAGGIVGRVLDGTVENCFSTAEIDNEANFDAKTGGIAGSLSISRVKNCYTTGKVRSTSDRTASAGGIAGEMDDNDHDTDRGSTISECAALNSEIDCEGKTERNYARIVGRLSATATPVDTLIANIGFEQMTDPDGKEEWKEVCLDCLDGLSISKEEIAKDGTLGGRFRAPAWFTANNHLPGLYGEPEKMPDYLKPMGIKSTDNSSIQVYPNPTSGVLKVETHNNASLQSVEIYDVMGKKISSNHLITTSSHHLIDITLFPAGVYFLKITTESGIVTKKVIKN